MCARRRGKDKMNNPIKELTKREWLIWLCSLAIVLVSNLLTADLDILTLAAAS